MPHYAPGRTPGAGPGFAHRNQDLASRGFASTGRSFDRSGFANGTRQRMLYRSHYRRGRHFDRDDFFYGSVIWPWWLNSYGYLGYPDFYQYPPWWDYEDSDSYDTQGAPPPDYNPQPAPEQQPDSAPLPPWPSINAPQNDAQPRPPAQSSAPPHPAAPITLVFNDGRPPEKIHNFVLTPATLYVMDQEQQEIPIAELDLAATAKVNHQAGVEFSLPAASR